MARSVWILGALCSLLNFKDVFAMTNEDDFMQNYMDKSQQKRKKPHTLLIPYLKCDVCSHLTKHLSRKMKSLKESTPKYEWKEELVLEKIENTCDPYTDDGIWMTLLDVKPVAKNKKKKKDTEEEEADYSDSDKKKKEKKKEGKYSRRKVTLEKVQMPASIIGDCRRKCESVAAACSSIIEDNDIEMADLLYAGAKRSALTNAVCPNYCKAAAIKRKKPLSKKVLKALEREVWREVDAETRQMISMLGQMPGNVKMFDPSAMMFDDDMDMGGFEDMADYGGFDEDAMDDVLNQDNDKYEL